jgi:hypothetical protein
VERFGWTLDAALDEEMKKANDEVSASPTGGPGEGRD